MPPRNCAALLWYCLSRYATAPAHINHTVVIPGPPTLFAGGTRNRCLGKHTGSGLPRHQAGAAPGMTTKKVRRILAIHRGTSMPLSWNEIKDRALRFSREWADEASEDAET